MFCRNCGKELHENAIACPSCGCPPKGSGTFCWQCGEPVVPAAIMCPKCGVGLRAAGQAGKTKMVAGLLNILLPMAGIGGIGRFYTGHTGIAVAQLLVGFFTCGIGLIWSIIDGIMILASNDMTDSDGNPLT